MEQENLNNISLNDERRNNYRNHIEAINGELGRIGTLLSILNNISYTYNNGTPGYKQIIESLLADYPGLLEDFNRTRSNDENMSR